MFVYYLIEAILSILGFYIGSELIVKGGKEIIQQGFMLGALSVLPELIILSNLLFHKNFYLALSSFFITALTIYTLGIAIVNVSVFLKWRKRRISIVNFKERRIILIIMSILLSIFILQKINLEIGIVSLFILSYYLMLRLNEVKFSVRSLLFMLSGITILWIASNNLVFMSSKFLPSWAFTIFLFPIVLNIQDIIVAIKGSLSSPELGSQMTLSFIVETIILSAFTLSLAGLLGGPEGVFIGINYSLLALILVSTLMFVLFNNNNLSIKESIILLSMYSLVPMSILLHA
ncbi:hypothetical protein D1867_08165 [Acidianus infernus]|uniref:Sodium:calcium antiporter n=1 Tax=Acidianus infernus TaxID=12915 RepID=A0A6A9QMS3_ACIIN|nr:hypothetical protein [Acidianus infernus]MUM65208.1 hypothetical protein [Acidianus infernus]